MNVAPIPPPPMPDVRRASRHVDDAHDAIERARKAWNADQLRDELNRAELCITRAFAELNGYKQP